MSPSSFDIGRAKNFLNIGENNVPAIADDTWWNTELASVRGDDLRLTLPSAFPIPLKTAYQISPNNGSQSQSMTTWYKAMWSLFIGFMRLSRNCLRTIYIIVILVCTDHLSCASIWLFFWKRRNFFYVFPWNNILKWYIFRGACLVLCEFAIA